jgi:hypothetical protein
VLRKHGGLPRGQDIHVGCACLVSIRASTAPVPSEATRSASKLHVRTHAGGAADVLQRVSVPQTIQRKQTTTGRQWLVTRDTVNIIAAVLVRLNLQLASPISLEKDGIVSVADAVASVTQLFDSSVRTCKKKNRRRTLKQ